MTAIPLSKAGVWQLTAGVRPDGRCPACGVDMRYDLATDRWFCENVGDNCTYQSPRLAQSLVEITKVHVLHYEHRHGDDVYVGLTDDAVRDHLHGIVVEWWDEEVRGRRGRMDRIPDDRDEAIEQYFDFVGPAESYTITDSTIL